MDHLHVLAAYPDLHRDQIEFLGGAGGFSGAVFWQVRDSNGLWCLRRWPREHPTEERLQWIHAVLFHVAQQEFTPIPAPRRTREGRSYLRHAGHFWELAPWLPGEHDSCDPATPGRLTAAMKALAQFHLAAASYPAVPAHHGPSPGIRDRWMQTRSLVSGGLEDLRRSVDADLIPQLYVRASRILARAPAVAPSVLKSLEHAMDLPVPLQPCIRDIWRDHVLFEGDCVSGLVDFGSMGVENVAADVARLLGSLVGDDPALRQLGLAAYGSIRPLSEVELSLVDVFDRSTVLLSGLNWIDWIYRQRRTFDDWQTVAGRLQGILTRLLTSQTR